MFMFSNFLQGKVPADQMNIYVGNLSFATTEDAIKNIFADYGEVSSVKIITDRETGRSRGFGFVEMPNDDEGRAAVEALSEYEFEGRPLKVNEARPRTERTDRRGGGGYGGGGGGGGRRGGGGRY